MDDERLGDTMGRKNISAWIFGALAGVLALTALVICLTARDAEPRLLGSASGAERCAQTMMEKLCSGDFAGASACMYGNPSLVSDGSRMDPAAALIWDAFVSSLEAVPKDGCYATVSGLARDYTVTSLDIPGLTQQLKAYAPAVLDARIEAAEDMSQVYDENHAYREEFTQSVLEEAAREVIAASAPTERTATVKLTYQDGRWWVLPDEALLAAISGGIL